MRNDIRCLCVTNWDAVLEFRALDPVRNIAWVADPEAIDSGMLISGNEIKLVATPKPVSRWQQRIKQMQDAQKLRNEK